MFSEEVHCAKKQAAAEEDTAMDDEERQAMHRRMAGRGAGAYATARGYQPFSARNGAYANLSAQERVAAQSARLKQEQNTARDREKAARERARRAAQVAAQHTASQEAAREAQREAARRNIADRRARLEEEQRAAREKEMRARVAAARGHAHREPPVDLRHKGERDRTPPKADAQAEQPTGGGSGSSGVEETAIERALRCGLHDVHGALGVGRGCHGTALHKAWRRASLEVHPDRNFGNEEAAAKAQQIVNAAHDLLQDPVKLRTHLQQTREDAAKARHTARPSTSRPGSRARGDPRRPTTSSTARGPKGSSSSYHPRGARGDPRRQTTSSTARGKPAARPHSAPPPPFAQHV